MIETLREYLEGGGRLHVDVHRGVIAAMTSPMATADRADQAVVARYEFDTLSDGGDPRPDRRLNPAQRVEATQAAGFLADYLQGAPDPELDRMIQAALPAPLALHLEAQTLPHRMHVGVPDGDFSSCDNCGSTLETNGAKALLISDRAGYSILHCDIAFCAGCVTSVAHDLGNASSSN